MNFKVGDVVKIKHEEELTEDVKFGWCAAMSPLSGKEFTITEIAPSGDIKGHGTDWAISGDMLKPVGEEKHIKLLDYVAKYGNKTVNEKELNNLLGVKPRRWTPEHGETYWFVDVEGRVSNYDWVGDGIDLNIISYSEVYKSREEAEFARDKQTFLLQMKRDFEDNTDAIDWEDGSQEKCYLSNDYGDGELSISHSKRLQIQGALHTTNSEWLKQYIEDNEEYIKKYVFDL